MGDQEHHDLADELQALFQERAHRFFAPDDRAEADDTDLPETGLVTGYFLIVEWAGDDGAAWLTYHFPPNQPVWRSHGLTAHAATDL